MVRFWEQLLYLFSWILWRLWYERYNKNKYFNSLTDVYDASTNVLLSKCCNDDVDKTLNYDTTSVSIKGQDDDVVQYFYKLDDNGQKRITVIKIMDKYHDDKYSLFYDRDSCTYAIIDSVNDKRYYFFEGDSIDPSDKSANEKAGFAELLLFDILDDEKIDRNEYASGISCFSQ